MKLEEVQRATRKRGRYYLAQSGLEEHFGNPLCFH